MREGENGSGNQSGAVRDPGGGRRQRRRHRGLKRAGGTQHRERRARHDDPAAREPIAEHLAGTREPAGDGAFRKAEAGGGFRLVQPLQGAQYERRAVLLRQRVQLLVDHGEQVRGFLGSGRRAVAHFGRVRPLHPRAPERAAPRLERGAVGDAVQPRREPVRRAHRVGPLGEYEERGLERVVRGVGVAQHAAAHAEHHRPVAADERAERVLIAPRAVAGQ